MTNKEKAPLRKAAQKLHETDPGYKRSGNFSFIVSLLYIILIALAIRQYVGEPYYVQGSSMYPTLIDGERIIIEKTTYSLGVPARYDIIVCNYPDRYESFVKRVIGLPGEIVQIKDGLVYINGVELDESEYWSDVILNDMLPRRVKDGYVFVMGDNRNNSKDSRNANVGDIAVADITGKARLVMWPVSQWRILG